MVYVEIIAPDGRLETGKPAGCLMYAAFINPWSETSVCMSIYMIFSLGETIRCLKPGRKDLGTLFPFFRLLIKTKANIDKICHFFSIVLYGKNKLVTKVYLSHLLFIIVLEDLSSEFRTGYLEQGSFKSEME